MAISPQEPAGEPFTEEEIRHIRLWALSEETLGWQLSAQIAYFATPAVFGIYGLATGSIVIVGVAFVCILLLVAWGLASTVRDHRKTLLMRSICTKLQSRLDGDRRDWPPNAKNAWRQPV